MKTMRFALISALSAILALVAIEVPAWQRVSDDQEFAGVVEFAQPVNFGSTWTIGKVAVTASAEEINAASDADGRVVTVLATNGAPITLNVSNTVVVLNGAGSASGSTNTVTLARPYPVGVSYLFRCATGSTNAVLLADASTNLALGADVALKATDTLTIYTVSTNEAVKVCESEN